MHHSNHTHPNNPIHHPNTAAVSLDKAVLWCLLLVLGLACAPTGPDADVFRTDDEAEETGQLPCEGQVQLVSGPNLKGSEAIITTDVAETHAVKVGDQIRVRADVDGFDVLFTVTEIVSNDDLGRVYLSNSGLARLERDDGFCGGVVTRIAPADPDEVDGQDGEFFESLEGSDFADLLVLAPHGGKIESGTDVLAELLAEHWPGTALSWICRGWGGSGAGAYQRWHVSSDVISTRSFPLLETLDGLSFERVVSFHGHGGPNGGCGFSEDVVVGGRAPTALLDTMRQALDAELDAHSVKLDGPGQKCTGTSGTNVINRFSVCGGVQLELSSSVRGDAEARAEIAEVVSAVMTQWSGCPTF